jgi:hypothetical protein
MLKALKATMQTRSSPSRLLPMPVLRSPAACSASLALVALVAVGWPAQGLRAAPADEPIEIIEAPTPGPVSLYASAYPVDACQGEVARAIRNQRGLADGKALHFTSVQHVAPRSRQEAAGVKGAGQYRNAQGRSTPFTYGCAFSARSGAVTGVLFRDPLAAAAAEPEARWEPDLTHISPQDCASAVATTLQVKYPRIGDIRLNAETWRMAPGPAGRTLLQGEGGVQRAQGMNAVPFSYSCDVDTRSGKVLEVKTSV